MSDQSAVFGLRCEWRRLHSVIFSFFCHVQYDVPQTLSECRLHQVVVFRPWIVLFAIGTTISHTSRQQRKGPTSPFGSPSLGSFPSGPAGTRTKHLHDLQNTQQFLAQLRPFASGHMQPYEVFEKGIRHIDPGRDAGRRPELVGDDISGLGDPGYRSVGSVLLDVSAHVRRLDRVEVEASRSERL